MKVRSFLSFVLTVLVFVVVKSSVYAEKGVEGSDIGTETDSLVKEVPFKIRAKVPPVMTVEITKGKDGVDLLDEKGMPKENLEDMMFKFKICGNLPRVKLSFSGSDGLSHIDGRDNLWRLQCKNHKKAYIPLYVRMFSRNLENYDYIQSNTNITLDREVQSDPKKDPEIVIAVRPVERYFYPGDYAGQLIVRVTAAD